MKKVLVAMSGGVDSSVSAFILKKRGFYCEGVTAIMHNEKEELPEYVVRARQCCEQIGIKHNILDFRKEFKEKVVKKFIEVYEEGKTPNPCILCNMFFKFGKLLQFCDEKGFDFFATGHYARIVFIKKIGRWFLKKSQNLHKDQSYFLYFLNQAQLKKIVFPLEDMDKADVKEIAKENNFESHKIKESQDICFVEKGKYSSFIEKNSSRSWLPGKFIDSAGNVLGEHKGIFNYTVGQRKGIGLSFKQPMFVKAIDSKANTVVLSKEEELFEKVVFARNIVLNIKEEVIGKISCKAKIRYRQNEAEAVFEKIADDMLKVEFKTPQRAIAKGQAIVIYKDDFVLGGGEIF